MKSSPQNLATVGRASSSRALSWSLTWSLTSALAATLSGGCVTTGTYKAKVAELDASTARERQLQADKDKLQSDLAQARKQLDDQTALVGELTGRLQKLGQNVDKLTSEKGQLTAGLDDARARLEELRKQKAAAEARAATFRTLVEKLRSMIDAGKLTVKIRNGRMLIALPNDVLFDSGRVDVKPAAKEAIAQVAQALSGIADRRFLVGGHTDNVPIKTARFPSNWELSAGRAIEVTRLLIADGMRPETLAAAGYAEFDPLGANDTPEHKAANRRIEIILEPNLSDLPSLDNLQSDASK